MSPGEPCGFSLCYSLLWCDATYGIPVHACCQTVGYSAGGAVYYFCLSAAYDVIVLHNVHEDDILHWFVIF